MEGTELEAEQAAGSKANQGAYQGASVISIG